MTTLEKLEDKYGLVMFRTDAVTELRKSKSSVIRMETKGKLVRIDDGDSTVKFRTEDIAKIIEGN